MKFIFSLTIIFISFSINAETFFFVPESHSVKEIQIEKLNGILVNDLCVKEKKVCSKLIDEIKKAPVELKSKTKGPLGNPASTNCEAHQGQSEILRDSKHNEYDFCFLNKKYFVDSWSLLK